MTMSRKTFSVGGLRTDERQWLIYGDEQMGAVIRGLEAWALMLLGTKLRNTGPDRIKALNGIGAFCQKVADERLVEMKHNGGAQEAAADWILLVSKWAAGKTPFTRDIARAVDELHAVATHNDSRGSNAGMNGGGVHRQTIRGD